MDVRRKGCGVLGIRSGSLPFPSLLPPPSVFPFRYQAGTCGSWGGCTSASSDRTQAAQFVSRDQALQATKGCYFMILSDQARPMYPFSAFPEEMEHLHPLNFELEVPLPHLH